MYCCLVWAFELAAQSAGSNNSHTATKQQIGIYRVAESHSSFKSINWPSSLSLFCSTTTSTSCTACGTVGINKSRDQTTAASYTTLTCLPLRSAWTTATPALCPMIMSCGSSLRGE